MSRGGGTATINVNRVDANISQSHRVPPFFFSSTTGSARTGVALRGVAWRARRHRGFFGRPPECACVPARPLWGVLAAAGQRRGARLSPGSSSPGSASQCLAMAWPGLAGRGRAADVLVVVRGAARRAAAGAAQTQCNIMTRIFFRNSAGRGVLG